MKIKHCLSMASILLCSAQQANAELTLSLDLIKDSGDRDMSASFSRSGNEFDTSSFVADSSGYRLRLGFGSVKENRTELYFSQYDVDDNGQFADKKEWELGVNYIFTFLKNPVNPLFKPVTPFLKAGFGFGQADTNMEIINYSGDTTDNIYNIHLNLGGGVSYSFTDNIAINGGIEYVYRNWQDLEYANAVTIGTSDSIFRFGVGINVSF